MSDSNVVKNTNNNNNKFVRKLKTGRTIEIENMTLDQMDDCKDAARILFQDGSASSITGTNKAKTMWLRFGLKGGDFQTSTQKVNGKFPDNAIKELSEDERD